MNAPPGFLAFVDQQTPGTSPNKPSPLSRTAPARAMQTEPLQGTPGPGTYEAATSFVPRHAIIAGKSMAATERIARVFMEPYAASIVNNPGKQILRGAPAWRMGVRDRSPGKLHMGAHAGSGSGAHSPGPKYYPKTESSAVAARLGTADRDRDANLRYLSAGHSESLKGHLSPGPIYRSPSGKGIAKTIGDAPVTVFGTSQRSEVVSRASLHVPGPGAHDVQSDAPSAHVRGGRFSPVKSRPTSPMRFDRFQTPFISAAHSTADNMRAKYNPGVGEYLPCSPEQTSRMKRQGASPFGRAHRDPGVVGEQRAFVDEGFLRMGTSGAEYQDVPDEWAYKPLVNHASFAKGERFVRPELGTSKAGPLISSLHAKHSQCGAEGPGPQAYDVLALEEHMRAKRNALSFARQPRDLASLRQNETIGPGPGAYYPRAGPDTPGWRMGSRLENEGALGAAMKTADAPGPGAYEVDKATSAQKKAGYSFGSAKDRRSFIPPSVTPGPGAHHPDEPETSRSASPVKFGSEAGTETRRGSPGKQRGQSFGARTEGGFISQAHSAADGYAKNSPGPKYSYGLEHTHRRASMHRFGKGTRDALTKLFTGHRSVSSGSKDAPGPGAYDVRGFRDPQGNKFERHGGYSFGTSKRPPLATVRF
ncbi:unnamed protein product [Pedinophyceae sp. YPF-701]|nr:unnamed protein product [Pedinophyceae sp. YPF-701]